MYVATLTAMRPTHTDFQRSNTAISTSLVSEAIQQLDTGAQFIITYARPYQV